MGWLRAAAIGVLLAGCSGAPGEEESSTPAFPPAPQSSASSSTVVPEGFSAVIIEVTAPDGSTESFCVWLADSAAERQRGLMEVTSLGGAAGMLFRFGTEQSSSFWMRDTVLPLSLGFFTGAGEFVSAIDMDPCAAGVSCPLYDAAGPYADGLEVPRGDLEALGVGPGSRLTVTERSCSPSG